MTSTDLRMTSVKLLRKLVSDVGLGNVLRVRKNRNQFGSIHVCIFYGSTLADRAVAHAFLTAINATVLGGLSKTPEHFDSATIVAYDMPA